MARINIEDSLSLDPRFIIIERKLPRFVALGAFIEIARLAQRYWKDGNKLIPKKVYSLNKFPKEFIKAEMVIEKENGFYLSGSEDAFAWVFSCVENGKKGGRPKRNNINNLTKPTDNPRITHENLPTPTPTPKRVLLVEEEKQREVFETSKVSGTLHQDCLDLNPLESEFIQSPVYNTQVVETAQVGVNFIPMEKAEERFDKKYVSTVENYLYLQFKSLSVTQHAIKAIKEFGTIEAMDQWFCELDSAYKKNTKNREKETPMRYKTSSFLQQIGVLNKQQ